MTLNDVLKIKAINAWRLFWLITGPISIAMIAAMTGADLSTGEGISSMIQLSVRCAVPLLYLAFAASSLQILFPGPFSRWLLRNRKYLGLCFAAAMAWQGFFILWLVTIYSDYYVNEVYVLRDAIEGVLGYLFLTAMTLTSFRFARRHMQPKQWKLLHKSGIYFLWAYAFSVYWWNLFYYQEPVWLDYIYYWSGFLAWAMRAAAWGKKRGGIKDTALAVKLLGGALVVCALVAACTGSVWLESAEDLLMPTVFLAGLELWLPYWPFTPFLPLFVLGLGIYLITSVTE